MKVALIPLAIGTLTSWILVGPFSVWLQATLPEQHFHTATTLEYVVEILTAPATYLALAVVASV